MLGPRRSRRRAGSRSARIAALLAALAAAALLAVPAAAQAAFGVVNPKAEPATTQAGAQTELELSFDVAEPDKQLRDVSIELPPGLSGNPQAVPQCAAASFEAGACDPASTVGASTTMATVILPPPFAVPTALHGTIYNLVPNPGEPGRLGLNINSPLPGVVPDIRKQIAITLRSDYGLTTDLSGLPSQVLGINIYVASVSLTLNEEFISNPSSCDVALTRFKIRSHTMAADAPFATGLADFNPTGCDQQPYAPRVSLLIDGGGGFSPGLSPTVTSTIEQAPGEANSRTVEVTMPVGVGARLEKIAAGGFCAPADFEAGACAPAQRVGEATASSPLLADPLAGPIYLVDSGGPLPRLGLELAGALTVRLYGESTLAGTRLRTVFDDLPDLPLPSFSLSFDGGPDGLMLVSPDELCAAPAFDATMTSHGGRVLQAGGTATVRSCAAAAAAGAVKGGKNKCKSKHKAKRRHKGKKRRGCKRKRKKRR